MQNNIPTEVKTSFAAEFVNMNRKTIRAIVGLLTGHSKFNRHMSTLIMTDEALCRLCQAEKETVLTDCPALGGMRLQLTSYMKENSLKDNHTKYMDATREASVDSSGRRSQWIFLVAVEQSSFRPPLSVNLITTRAIRLYAGTSMSPFSVDSHI